jgi:hypothetical protein
MGKIKGRPKPYLTWLGAVRWTPFIGRGIIIVKYWFSVNDEEQERRFRDRMMLTSVLLAAYWAGRDLQIPPAPDRKSSALGCYERRPSTLMQRLLVARHPMAGR